MEKVFFGEEWREYTVKVYDNGNTKWWLDGKLHREDGPAIERADGYKAWWLNGKLHREDGPAVEHPSGIKEWWLNGKRQPKRELISESAQNTRSKGESMKEYIVKNQPMLDTYKGRIRS